MNTTVKGKGSSGVRDPPGSTRGEVGVPRLRRGSLSLSKNNPRFEPPSGVKECCWKPRNKWEKKTGFNSIRGVLEPLFRDTGVRRGVVGRSRCVGSSETPLERRRPKGRTPTEEVDHSQRGSVPDDSKGSRGGWDGGRCLITEVSCVIVPKVVLYPFRFQMS